MTKKWLLAQGPEFDRHAVDNLVKSRQLEVLAPGVYKLPATRLSWEGVVASLQTILGLDLFVGGMSALEIHGYSHYLPLSHQHTVHLYGSDPLPSWVNGSVADVTFVRHSALRTLDEAGLVTRQIDNMRDNSLQYSLSSAERAYLEILMDVPEDISFEHADQLLQGMMSLSPRKLETLLRACRDIKVRRLFYWLAERHHHPWLDRLSGPTELDDLGLGSGNRMLVKGGKLVTRYMITVPEDMWTPTPHITDR